MSKVHYGEMQHACMKHGLEIMAGNICLAWSTARVLIHEPCLDSPDRLRVLMDKNVDDICSILRKPGDKSANGSPNKVYQICYDSGEPEACSHSTSSEVEMYL